MYNIVLIEAIRITIKLTLTRQRTRNPAVGSPSGVTSTSTRRTLTLPNPDSRLGITTRTPPKRQTERKSHTPNSYPAHTGHNTQQCAPPFAYHHKRPHSLTSGLTVAVSNNMSQQQVYIPQACSHPTRLHHTGPASPHKAPWLGSGRSWRGEPPASQRRASNYRTYRSLKRGGRSLVETDPPLAPHLPLTPQNTRYNGAHVDTTVGRYLGIPEACALMSGL